MNNLSKNDFVNLIVASCNITKSDAEKAITHFTKGIEEVISKGDKLTLVGFGSFYVAENKAKVGRNPRTGETINIAASKTPKFKAGAVLKKLCTK